MIALALLAAAPLTCGAVPRPGIAELELDGNWRGTAVERCRRAARRLGRRGFRFVGYRTAAQVRAATRADIAFLSPAERATVVGVAPVATIVAASTQVLVAKRDTLGGGRPLICFIIGSAAEDALAAWLERGRRAAIPLGFQEPDEMADGLASGKCAAMAIDAADRKDDDQVIATLAVLPIDAYAPADRARVVAAALRD